MALTGTPVENNLSELWALLDWTTPGLLGPLTSFRARHARAVETGEDEQAVQRLARLVRPFLGDGPAAGAAQRLRGVREAGVPPVLAGPLDQAGRVGERCLVPA